MLLKMHQTTLPPSAVHFMENMATVQPTVRLALLVNPCNAFQNFQIGQNG